MASSSGELILMKILLLQESEGQASLKDTDDVVAVSSGTFPIFVGHKHLDGGLSFPSFYPHDLMLWMKLANQHLFSFM